MCLFFLGLVLFLGANSQVVFQENFDLVADGSLPANWTRFNVDGLTPYTNLSWVTDAWVCKTYGAITSKAAWSTSYYTPAGIANDWMFTPAIVIPATYPVLQFTELAQDAGYPDGYELRISTSAPALGNLMSSTVVLTVPAATNPKSTRAVNLAAYAGQTVYIGWRNNSNDKFMLGIDDIVVKSLRANGTSILSLDLPNYVQINTPKTIAGVLTNTGGITITSLNLNYSINGGAAVTQNITGLNIASLTNYNYSHPTVWTTPSTSGSYTVKLWASNINGVSGIYSDTLSKQVVVLSQLPAKKVIVEEATGAWCGYCPDGAVKLQALMGSNPNVIGVAIHDNDQMAFADGNTVNAAYISGFPSGLVDRFKFEGENAVELDRGQWAAKATERQQMPTPVKVTGTNTYDAGSRLLTVNLTARFYAPMSGDYRFNCYVVEDSCSGTGTGWNQSNYYNTTAGHPMNGLGNPIVGYQHRHVLRNMLGGPWGTATSIPATIVANTDYTKTFTLTLPAGYNPARILVVGLVQKYSANESDREILNADEMFLNGGTGIAENSAIAQFNVYPNPASGSSTMSIVLKQASELSVSVMNIVGETVRTQNFGTVEAGSFNTTLDLSNLTKGVYMVKINAGNQTSFQKVMVY